MCSASRGGGLGKTIGKLVIERNKQLAAKSRETTIAGMASREASLVAQAGSNPNVYGRATTGLQIPGG